MRIRLDKIGAEPFQWQETVEISADELKRAEVLGLEIEDVDSDSGVARGVKGAIRFRPNAWRGLKTRGSARTVPMWPDLREILRPFIGERTTGLLFPSDRGGMRRDLRKALDRIGDIGRQGHRHGADVVARGLGVAAAAPGIDRCDRHHGIGGQFAVAFEIQTQTAGADRQHDIIDGGGGADVLNGNDGDDTLTGAGQGDVLSGGRLARTAAGSGTCVGT